MIFGGKKRPYYGERKTTRCFALIPVRFISGGWIWLQYYYADLTYRRSEHGENRGYWKLICRYVNNTTNIT